MPKRPSAMASLYTRRLVISVTPLAALMIMIGLSFLVWQTLINVSNAIAVSCAILAAFTTASARYHLKHLRYEMTAHFASLTHDMATENRPVVITSKVESAKPGFARAAK